MISALYERMAASRTYDLLMRLPIAGWHLWLSYLVGTEIMRAAADPRVAYPVLVVVAKMATFLFLISVALFSLARKSPILRCSGLRGRIVALLGAFCFGLIFFLPARPLPPAALALSISLIIFGWALAAYTVWHLGRALSIMPEARHLVTSGPYRIVRHPLYLCELVAMMGIALQYEWPAALALWLIQVGFLYARVLNEERVLRTAFPKYDSYARQTARVLPGVY